jgi:hypothetical protein
MHSEALIGLSEDPSDCASCDGKRCRSMLVKGNKKQSDGRHHSHGSSWCFLQSPRGSSRRVMILHVEASESFFWSTWKHDGRPRYDARHQHFCTWAIGVREKERSFSYLTQTTANHLSHHENNKHIFGNMGSCSRSDKNWGLCSSVFAAISIVLHTLRAHHQP